MKYIRCNVATNCMLHVSSHECVNIVVGDTGEAAYRKLRSVHYPRGPIYLCLSHSLVIFQQYSATTTHLGVHELPDSVAHPAADLDSHHSLTWADDGGRVMGPLSAKHPRHEPVVWSAEWLRHIRYQS